MSVTEQQLERRARDRSQGILLRRRRNELPDSEADRRLKPPSSFDIAAALELHLDEVKTRRSMIALLEAWLTESRTGDPQEQDADYLQAVERAIEVMKSAPDVLTGIAVLQRR